MKKSKRIIYIILCALLLMNCSVCPAIATEHISSVNPSSKSSPDSLDALDILLISHNALSGEDAFGIDMWSQITGINSIHPLYYAGDTSDSIFAYYISFEPTGYVIINNNKDNPIVIEFSNKNHSELEELIHSSSKVYYLAPNSFFSADTYARALSSSERKPSTIEPDKFVSYLKSTNYIAKAELNQQKTKIQGLVSVQNISKSYTLQELKKMYNILDWSALSSSSFKSNSLAQCSNVHYGTTDEFYNINGAKNHCGAVAAFNVVTYYKQIKGYKELYINNNRIDTFSSIFQKMGDGPVIWAQYNSALKKYVANCGYTYKTKYGTDYSIVKSGIDQGHMVTLLLQANLTNWHYVNAVGYREYYSGSKYIRIVDGWEDDTMRFILSTNMNSCNVTWIEQ